ncbi:MAG: RDD family protein [Chloroflexota bacterium]|nr:RDD family protein [Chloroflexota bacterium]
MTQSGQPGGSPPPPPASSPPPSAPPPDWQSTPQQPSSPPAAGSSGGSGGAPSWTANITSQAPVAGPSGYYYADLPNRIIAFIIDYILFFVVFLIVGVLTVSLFGINTIVGQMQTTTSVLFQNVLSYAIVGAYFVYTWTAMRGTLGMKVLGMQIGDQADGRTITFNQAVIRYAVMFGPAFVAGLLSAFILSLGAIASLLALIWFIAILVTTAQSPTKQGIHDKYARTMVVKAARSVG